MSSFQKAKNNAVNINTDMSSCSDLQKSVERRPGSRVSRRGKSASAFRTISEVAEVLGVQQHVLRFWETKFSQIRPLKRGGGRRYYRPEDMALLQRIHELLYTQGYTIKGVQKLLKEQGKNRVLHENAGVPDTVSIVDDAHSAGMLSKAQRSLVESMLQDLKDLRDLVKK